MVKEKLGFLMIATFPFGRSLPKPHRFSIQFLCHSAAHVGGNERRSGVDLRGKPIDSVAKFFEFGLQMLDPTKARFTSDTPSPHIHPEFQLLLFDCGELTGNGLNCPVSLVVADFRPQCRSGIEDILRAGTSVGVAGGGGCADSG